MLALARVGANLSACRLVGKSESWRVGKLAGVRREEERGAIAECSDCRVMSVQVDR